MITGVRSVALTVRDLDRVSRFYAEVVGLAVLGAARPGGEEVPLLELLHRPGALAAEGTAAGLFHTAFLLPHRADLGRWLAHAARLGQALDGAADHLVSEAVYLRDPEGNGIEIYADRARESWRWTETAAGPRITMANAPLDRTGLLALADGAWAGAPAGTTVGHVHLQVGAIDPAAAFLTGVLGLDVTVAWPQAVFLSGAGYHHHVAANTWNSAGAGLRDARCAGLACVTLGVTPGVMPGMTEAKGMSGASHVDPWGTVFRLQLFQPDEDRS